MPQWAGRRCKTEEWHTDREGESECRMQVEMAREEEGEGRRAGWGVHA